MTGRRKVRVHKEKIDRTSVYYQDGTRRQRTKHITDLGTPNPEKYVIAEGGDYQLYSYPHSNPENVFLAVKGVVELFPLKDAIRLFGRISERLRTYDLRLRRGVKRLDIQGCFLQSALRAGIKAQSMLQLEIKKEYILYTIGKSNLDPYADTPEVKEWVRRKKREIRRRLR